MRIQELDPKKRYFVLVDSDYMTEDELIAISGKLKEQGVNAVVLAGANIRGGETYYGLYCEQCGVWWVQPDNSRIVFYPAPEIANAHLNDRGWFQRGPVHPWKVQEFGKEEFLDHRNLPRGAVLCPVRLQNLAERQANEERAKG